TTGDEGTQAFTKAHSHVPKIQLWLDNLSSRRCLLWPLGPERLLIGR
ncbi:MAG: hypothetical protein ACJA2P_001857, partial [Rhodoferax sp.]